MNSYGQRKFDNLNSPELFPLKRYFIDGAYFIFGHVCLQRTLGLGYYSPWATSHLPTRAQRNHFFMQAGYRIPPGETRVLASLNASMSPKEILSRLNAE